MSLTRIDLDKATYEQLLEFAHTAGMELTKTHEEKSERGRKALMRLLATGGYERGIFVAESSPLQLGVVKTPKAPLGEYDPDNERWAHLMLNGSTSGVGGGELAPVFVGINSDTIYVPYNRQVVIREIFYMHIRDCKDTISEQKRNSEGKMARGMIRYEVDRYPMSFYGFVGYVKDGRPAIADREGVLFIPPSSMGNLRKMQRNEFDAIDTAVA